jgi:hypothetical protein
VVILSRAHVATFYRNFYRPQNTILVIVGDVDPAAADRLLDPMIEAEPTNAELLYLKGMRHLRAGRTDAARRAEHFGEAQRWFARAHQGDEFHFQTLYRYAESLAVDEAFVSENTTNVLLLANQIAPQVREIALSAANLLIRRGAFEEAEAILAPLANSSHGRRAAGITETLLERARARNSHDVPDVFNHPEPTEED